MRKSSNNSLVMIEPRQCGVFPCKVTAAGFERQGPLPLCVGDQIRQPSTIFRSSKLGIPSLSSDYTLVFSTLLPQCKKHVKRFPRPRSSEELYNREKELELKHF